MEKGFTLIELMIAIFIIGVLSVTSLMLYEAPVQKTKQAIAQFDLLNLALLLQDCHEKDGRYNGLCKKELRFHPESKDYKIEVISANENTFKIAAIPNASLNQAQTYYLDQEGGIYSLFQQE